MKKLQKSFQFIDISKNVNVTSYFDNPVGLEFTIGTETRSIGFYIELVRRRDYITYVTVNWGDGTQSILTEDAFIPHEYTTAGVYYVNISDAHNVGTLFIVPNDLYAYDTIKAAEYRDFINLRTLGIWSRVNEIEDYPFTNCVLLHTINFKYFSLTELQNSITANLELFQISLSGFDQTLTSIGDSFFSNCINLETINISTDTQYDPNVLDSILIQLNNSGFSYTNVYASGFRTTSSDTAVYELENRNCQIEVSKNAEINIIDFNINGISFYVDNARQYSGFDKVLIEDSVDNFSYSSLNEFSAFPYVPFSGQLDNFNPGITPVYGMYYRLVVKNSMGTNINSLGIQYLVL